MKEVDPKPEDAPARPDWARLYDEVGERVFHMLFQMTGDRTEAEDLTHDVFVRVHERRHQYAGRGSVQGWVFQIARNLARQRFRSRRRRGRRIALAHVELGGSQENASPEDKLTVRHALDQLSIGQRAALLLHVVYGYSHREIGEMLGIAEGSSKARVSRAKERVRQIMRTPNKEQVS